MIRLLAAASLLLPSAIYAETVTFRSGEHETFSRLVLAIPPNTTWQIGRNDAGYELRMPDDQVDYDTSAAFEKIPRERIEALQADAGRLQLLVSCQCHVDAFLWRENRLVIDVVDGDAPAGSEFETSLDPVPNPELMMVHGTDVEASVDQSPPLVSLPTVVNEAIEELPLPFRVAEPSQSLATPDKAPSGFAVPSLLDSSTPPTPGVREFEEALLRGISRAASQGLLSPQNVVVPGPVVETDEEDFGSEEFPEPLPSQAPPLPNTPGIVARTSIEEQIPGAVSARTDEGDVCPDEAIVNLQSWADETAFADQLARYRDALTTAAGDIDPESAADLSRFYIHFGFGLEARQHLSQTALDGFQLALLYDMSFIVEGESAPSGLLSEYSNCPSDIALWAILSTSDSEKISTADRNSIIQSFRRLPIAIRPPIGARLAEIFLSIGDSETADVVYGAIGGDTSGTQPGSDEVRAMIDLATQPNGEVVRRLLDASENDSRFSPETTLVLMQEILETNRSIPLELIELSELHRFELAGQEESLSQELLIAETEAHIRNSNLDRALVKIDRGAVALDEERKRLTSLVYEAIAARSNDEEFLEYSFTDGLPDLEAKTENQIARRLIDLGFSERAGALLRAEARQDDARDRRLIKARISLQLQDFDAVSSLLSDQENPQARELIAEALQGDGDFVSAFEVLDQLENQGPSELLAWRAGAWSRLSDESNETGLTQFADLQLQPEETDRPAPGEVPGPSIGQQLLSESSVTRETVDRFLATFTVE